jgi:hypothetical protein
MIIVDYNKELTRVKYIIYSIYSLFYIFFAILLLNSQKITGISAIYWRIKWQNHTQMI